MMEEEEAPANLIISALSTLSPSHLSDLTHSIFSDVHFHRRRLSALLSSPTLFSLSLRHLHSLSLPHKTLLIARHLLSSLRRLSRPFHPSSAANPPPPSAADLDAALLLLLLCDVRRHHPTALHTPLARWRPTLCTLYAQSLLTLSGIGSSRGAALVPYVETVARCWKFVGGRQEKAREVAASPVAVVELPAVEVCGGEAVECVICREEMREGREVCRLPCEHLFHWLCILPWLRKRNTCPSCRFQLPTDDVFGEIERLWGVLIKAAAMVNSCDGD